MDQSRGSGCCTVDSFSYSRELDRPDYSSYLNIASPGASSGGMSLKRGRHEMTADQDSGVGASDTSSVHECRALTPLRDTKPLCSSTPLWRPFEEKPLDLSSNLPLNLTSKRRVLQSAEGHIQQPQPYPSPYQRKSSFSSCSPTQLSSPMLPQFYLNYTPMASPSVLHVIAYATNLYQPSGSLLSPFMVDTDREREANAAPQIITSSIAKPSLPVLSSASTSGRLPLSDIASNVPGAEKRRLTTADPIPSKLSRNSENRPLKRTLTKAAVDSSKVSKKKKRVKPSPYGDHELHKIEIIFEDSPLKTKYCPNGRYAVPKVPDDTAQQDILKKELLQLIDTSNLPKVPSALQFNIHALCFYPLMEHLISLHKDGVDLETLTFGAYGQAFCNLKMAATTEEDFNKTLDEMSYKGDDGLRHCKVVVNGVVCNRTTKDIGKMRRHSKNHYPEKKWVCCFCRVQMPDMTDMERHTSTHNGLKPFGCDKCDKEFSQKITLAQHMDSVHKTKLKEMDPKKMFVCRQDGCLFREDQRDELIKHMEKHHAHEDFLEKRRKKQKWPFDI